MAKVIEELPRRVGGARGRTEKYDYDAWFDGKVWQLDEGSDFESSKESFLSSIRNAADKRGMKLQTRVLSDAVVLQAAKLTPEDIALREQRREQYRKDVEAGKVKPRGRRKAENGTK